MILLSSIINKFKEQFFKTYHQSILPSHRKALSVMENCRKNLNLYMLADCSNNDCNHQTYIPHSCGHRNCPHCQNHESQAWIENQMSQQLPCQYYLLTFTIPSEFRDLVWRNQKIIYSLLIQSVKKTLMLFTKNDKKLGGTAGFTMILHTHSRQLNFHPHVHVLMPGASINYKTRSWQKKSAKYLFHHKSLAKVFAAKLLESLTANKFEIPASCLTEWVVGCKNVGNGNHAIIYLGRYLYRGVISEKDILKSEDGMVTFRYRNSKTKKMEIRTVKGEYFLWLLMQHILPKGFRRVRAYGFLHHCSKKLIKLLQYILGFNPSKWQNKAKKRADIICKFCGSVMEIISTQIIPIRSYRYKLSIPT